MINIEGNKILRFTCAALHAHYTQHSTVYRMNLKYSFNTVCSEVIFTVGGGGLIGQVFVRKNVYGGPLPLSMSTEIH